MTPITTEWLIDWAASHNIRATMDGVLSLMYKSATPSTRVTVITDTERTPTDLVLLANRLVWVEAENETVELSDQDRKYVFWIRESGIWTEMTEALASEAFSSLLNYGQRARPEGLLLGEEESRVAVLLSLYTILFGWDAYLAPFSAKFLCHISHDGYIDLRAPDEATMRSLGQRFEAWSAELRSV